MSSLKSFAKKYIYPQWPWYLFGFIALAITNLISLKVPLLAKNVVNQMGDRSDLNQLENVAILIIALGFLQIVIRSLSRILIFWPGRKMEANVRGDLFQKLMHLPQAFFDRFEMGDLISRISNDVKICKSFFVY